MFDLFWSNSWVLPFECVFFVEGKIKYRPKCIPQSDQVGPPLKRTFFWIQLSSEIQRLGGTKFARGT